jgi:HK97 gp10 family phage protein
MSDENIFGGRELDAFLQTLPVKIEKNIMRAALRAGAAEFRDAVRAGINDETGELSKSVKTSTSAKGGRVMAKLRVGNKKAWYGRLVEFGTKAHKIVPKKAGSLSFNGIQVREVSHPGAKPSPFMRPAFDSKASAAITAVGQKIRSRLTAEGINTPAPEVE